MGEEAVVVPLALEKINLGYALNEELSLMKSMTGVAKISRKINQEIKFLQKMVANGSLKLSHVTCSNLTHYDFLVEVLKTQRNVIEVDAALKSDNRKTPLRVDIICEGGQKWIKVIARSSNSIRDVALGHCEYGAKSILDQAKEFVCVAEQNLHMFQSPIIVFQFCNAIDDELKIALEEIGVTVQTTLEFPKPQCSLSRPETMNVRTLNLDITAMLAYVSALTNGSTCWKFKEPILNQQSEWELEKPVKPVMDKLFEDRRLVCCKTAVDSFKEIVDMLGGPNEKQRAKELLNRVEILGDIENIPDNLVALSVAGKIKSRSLKIFAFGVRMKGVTVTSNEGFIRSAKMKGVNIPAFIISARALTESKEKMAKKMGDCSNTLVQS